MRAQPSGNKDKLTSSPLGCSTIQAQKLNCLILYHSPNLDHLLWLLDALFSHIYSPEAQKRMFTVHCLEIRCPTEKSKQTFTRTQELFYNFNCRKKNEIVLKQLGEVKQT